MQNEVAIVKVCFVLLQRKIEDFLVAEIKKNEPVLAAKPDIAAYLLIQLFSATARNPQMSFEEMRLCMSFRDTSGSNKG